MQLAAAVLRYLDAHRVTDATARKLRHRLNCWFRHSARRSTRLSAAAFDEFRHNATAAGLSPRTVEETVSDVARVAGVNDVGTRLRRWKTATCRPVPTLAVLATAYDNADAAVWPDPDTVRTPALMRVPAAAFWRAFLVVAFVTGLRLRDLRSVTWQSIDEHGIRWTASKTGRVHTYPPCAVLIRHLRPLRVAGDLRVFPVSASQERLLRRELVRISGSPELTPQAIRRASITQWAIASPDAGRIIHGSADLGVLAHYLDVRRVLAAALPRLQFPAAFLTAAERAERAGRTRRLLTIADQLPVDRLDDLLRVGEAFAG